MDYNYVSVQGYIAYKSHKDSERIPQRMWRQMAQNINWVYSTSIGPAWVGRPVGDAAWKMNQAYGISNSWGKLCNTYFWIVQGSGATKDCQHSFRHLLVVNPSPILNPLIGYLLVFLGNVWLAKANCMFIHFRKIFNYTHVKNCVAKSVSFIWISTMLNQIVINLFVSETSRKRQRIFAKISDSWNTIKMIYT